MIKKEETKHHTKHIFSRIQTITCFLKTPILKYPHGFNHQNQLKNKQLST